jgi:predicted Zn-dependent peptidase
MTIGIAGDVSAAEAKRLAEKYFGRLPARPLPARYRTEEPVQEGEKRVAVASPAQPFLAIAYKRPDRHSPDDAAIAVLDAILSDGRTGLIYKDMVRDKQMALGAGSQPEFPGGKYPSLFLFFVAPSTGHSVEENEKELYQIIEQVKTTKTDEQTLTRIKTKLRADLIRKLASNTGLAVELCSYYVNYGDWRKLFTELDEYNKVTAEDVQRAAKSYLVPEHRTVAYTFVPAPSETPSGTPSENGGAK